MSEGRLVFAWGRGEEGKRGRELVYWEVGLERAKCIMNDPCPKSVFYAEYSTVAFLHDESCL